PYEPGPYDLEEIPREYRQATPQEAFQEKMQRFRNGTAAMSKSVRMRARHWKLLLRISETEENHILGPGIVEAHLCCMEDNQSVIRLMSGGTQFRTSVYDIEHGVMRHLLQVHRGEMGEDARDE